MNEKEKQPQAVVYTFSREKLDEFRDMSVETRLRWLEETNAFINRTLGFEKRAAADERFRIFVNNEDSSP